MIRHFWNIYCANSSVEVIHNVELVTRRYGFIVDYKKFAADYFILEIEIEHDKIEGFFYELSLFFEIEKFNQLHLNRAGDDTVFINIKLVQ